MFPHRLPRLILCAVALAIAAAPLARAQTSSPGVLQIGDKMSFDVVNNQGVFTVSISRLAGSAGAVGATYETVDGTALAGRDYQAVTGTVTWADGDTADKIVHVISINSVPFSGSRSFNLVLTNPTGGATIGHVSALLTVLGTLDIQPTVALTSPPPGLALTSGDSLPLAASVTDSSGILAKVQFLLDGQLAGEVQDGSPYTFATTAPAAGAHQISAVAIDNEGRQSVSTQDLTVLAVDPANPPPAAAIVTDLDGRALAAGAKVTISASGVAANGEPLQELDFYADGVLFESIKPDASVSRRPITRGRGPVTRANDGGVAANSVYQAKYTVPGVDKLISILSVAITRAGLAHVSAPVTVQAVANTSDHAPKVKLGGFANGAQLSVGAKVSVPVSVSDPDAGNANAILLGPVRRDFNVSALISKVEYYLNSLKVKESTSAPYAYDFAPPSAGTYVLSAIATDGAGLSTVSKPVTVEAVVSTVVTLSTVHDGHAAPGGVGRVLFTRSGGDVSGPLNVAYSLKGDAVNGVDYTTPDGQPLSGTFTIPAGVSTKKLKVGILGAGAGKIKFKLQASPDGEYQLGASRGANIIITDAP